MIRTPIDPRKFIEASSFKTGEEVKFRIPILDVRKTPFERRRVMKFVTEANGDVSKFVPGKYGYGPLGPQKY